MSKEWTITSVRFEDTKERPELFWGENTPDGMMGIAFARMTDGREFFVSQLFTRELWNRLGPVGCGNLLRDSVQPPPDEPPR